MLKATTSLVNAYSIFHVLKISIKAKTVDPFKSPPDLGLVAFYIGAIIYNMGSVAQGLHQSSIVPIKFPPFLSKGPLRQWPNLQTTLSLVTTSLMSLVGWGVYVQNQGTKKFKRFVRTKGLILLIANTYLFASSGWSLVRRDQLF